jgi:hypothetical protein
LRETIRELPGCAMVATSQSSLIDNQEWREAGNRVVGQEPEEPLTTL